MACWQRWRLYAFFSPLVMIFPCMAVPPFIAHALPPLQAVCGGLALSLWGHVQVVGRNVLHGPVVTRLERPLSDQAMSPCTCDTEYTPFSLSGMTLVSSVHGSTAIA